MGHVANFKKENPPKRVWGCSPCGMCPGDVFALPPEPIEPAQALLLGIRELNTTNPTDMELADVELAPKGLDGRFVQGFFVEALQSLFKVLEF